MRGRLAFTGHGHYGAAAGDGCALGLQAHEHTEFAVLVLAWRVAWANGGHPAVLQKIEAPVFQQRAIAGSAAAAAALVSQINASMARLQTMGVHTVALPCNTMHLFRDQFRLPPGVRFLNLIATVTEVLRRRRVRHVGLLATGLTVQFGLYHRYLQAQGLTVHVPEPTLQARVARGIGAYVRTGVVGPAAARALSVAIVNATAAGVDALVLGCTDIGGMLPQVDVRCTLPIIDSMDVLAKRCAQLSV